MKFKKIAACLVALAFVFASAAGTADAAKGGAKMFSGPKISTPKVNTPAPAPKANTTAPKASGPNNQEYAPSKAAKDLPNNAPAAKANTAANAMNNPAMHHTGWGNTLRNMGLLAGGMMLGSMLGSMFGFGGGVIGDILGLVINVLLFFLVVKIILGIIGMFLARRSQQAENDAHSQQTAYRSSPVRDIRRDGQGMINVNPSQPHTGRDYDARTTANRYRNM